MTDHGWSPRRRGLLLAGVVAMVAAVVLVVVVIRAQVSAPEPTSSGKIRAESPSGHSSRAPRADTVKGPTKVPLGPSKPISISIPAIGVNSPVHPIGLAADGTLAVPQPGPYLDHAAWFENSPTPGQPGPAIIEGHVDSTEGPSVFFKLGDLKPGDDIVVRRADGRVLTFRVNAVRDFLKSRFPTRLVYAYQHGEGLLPTLRLITCSDFDASIRHHVGNEVVFAHLTHATKASG